MTITQYLEMDVLIVQLKLDGNSFFKLKNSNHLGIVLDLQVHVEDVEIQLFNLVSRYLSIFKLIIHKSFSVMMEISYLEMDVIQDV